ATLTTRLRRLVAKRVADQRQGVFFVGTSSGAAVNDPMGSVGSRFPMVQVYRRYPMMPTGDED
ncbi:MAG: hypothetical protein ABSH22_17800, partial [Tepidisphaeraceae bacterium]